MCGIFGVVSTSGPLDPHGSNALAAMDASLRHRGPDDSGLLLDGPCALGMRRLAIIDLAGGHQPIASEDHSVWVVFNGEIYNHAELRRGLEARGHRFSTATDTEVIVHLYEDRGDEFADSLRGMFACAVWDRRKQSLLLTRDRLGIKPLYYSETPRGLVFASELGALAAHPWVGREVDPTALSHYLSFGTTPIDRAILRQVRKLPPAHHLTFQGGRATLRRWWDLRPPRRREISEAEAIERVYALTADAVQSHLVADVPVGAFLSGGIDSATVVALMARSGHVPRTFSIGFDERDFDELRLARETARAFGTIHEEEVIRPGAALWSLVESVVRSLDEPFADVSAIPTWLVARMAARRVKVVLSGDGGDEVFGGYDHYVGGLVDARRFVRLPAPARRALGGIAAALPDGAPGKRWLRHAALPKRLRFLDGESLFQADLKARLVGPALAEALACADDPLELRARLLASAPGDALGRLMYLDTVTYLPLDILTKVDRMSMAHSLEVRPPLLDTPLVEAMAALPARFKVAGRARKILFKKAVRGLIPDAIIDRPKRGFGVPVRHWMRGPLGVAARAILTERRARERGLFDEKFVASLFTEHASGRRDQSLPIWGLLVLELWLREFVDGPAARLAPREARLA